MASSGNASLMSAADIQGVNDFQYEDIGIPEWGNRKVRIRVMASEDRHQFEGAVNRAKEEKKWTADLFDARLAWLCLCDAKGERLFRDEEQIWDVLAKKSGNALSRIVKVAMKLNLMTDEAIEKEKNNSSAPPKSPSGSNSATDTTSPTLPSSDAKLTLANSVV